jgi:predicted RNase H-like nuclease (RuvC/YqgF family)
MFGGIKRGIISIKANDPHLSNFISEEKDKIASIKSVASFTTSSSQYFSLWSEGEHEDLKDIAEKYSIMSEEFSLMLMEWEYAQVEFREKLKAIRTMSDEISALKYKIKTQTDKYDKDKRSGKQVEESLFQIRALENSLKNETCNFETQKRVLLQEGLVGQFNGILKFAQKVV